MFFQHVLYEDEVFFLVLCQICHIRKIFLRGKHSKLSSDAKGCHRRKRQFTKSLKCDFAKRWLLHLCGLQWASVTFLIHASHNCYASILINLTVYTAWLCVCLCATSVNATQSLFLLKSKLRVYARKKANQSISTENNEIYQIKLKQTL